MKNLLFAGMALLCLFSKPALSQDKETGPSGPVTLINVFTVPAGKEVETIAFWEMAAKFLRAQPGYISTELHKSVRPSARHRLINIAKWKSAEAFKSATTAMRTTSGIKPVKGLSFDAALYTVIRTD